MLPVGLFRPAQRSVALDEEKPSKPSCRANACPRIEGSVTPHPMWNLMGLLRIEALSCPRGTEATYPPPDEGICGQLPDVVERARAGRGDICSNPVLNSFGTLTKLPNLSVYPFCHLEKRAALHSCPNEISNADPRCCPPAYGSRPEIFLSSHFLLWLPCLLGL